MNTAVKLTLRIAFLVALVYVLAAVFGFAHKSRGGWGGKGCRRFPSPVSQPSYPWTSTGMRATLIATPGTDVPMVGINSQVP